MFIDRLLAIVDEDLNIGYVKQKDIMEQVEGNTLLFYHHP